MHANIPLQLTRFIGRERESGDVKRLLAETRLLPVAAIKQVSDDAFETGRQPAILGGCRHNGFDDPIKRFLNGFRPRNGWAPCQRGYSGGSGALMRQSQPNVDRAQVAVLY